MADDAVFNIWYDLPLEKVINPENTIYGKGWFNAEDIRRSYDLFETKYKNHPKFAKSWKEYNEAVGFHTLPVNLKNLSSFKKPIPIEMQPTTT